MNKSVSMHRLGDKAFKNKNDTLLADRVPVKPLQFVDDVAPADQDAVSARESGQRLTWALNRISPSSRVKMPHHADSELEISLFVSFFLLLYYLELLCSNKYICIISNLIYQVSAAVCTNLITKLGTSNIAMRDPSYTIIAQKPK